ncbi:hypothetical protein Lal_00048425, partial [Lupinus albus]
WGLREEVRRREKGEKRGENAKVRRRRKSESQIFQFSSYQRWRLGASGDASRLSYGNGSFSSPFSSPMSNGDDSGAKWADCYSFFLPAQALFKVAL